MKMDRIWNVLEQSMHYIIVQVMQFRISDAGWRKWCQFVKFGIVGLLNTLISYVVYVILVFFSVHYIVASLAGFFVSVVNAYYWNNKYVFFSDETDKPIWWKVFLKTFMSYAGTGIVLNNIMLILWVDIIGINQILGPVLNLFITIPLNFLLNKYWAFKKDNID